MANQKKKFFQQDGAVYCRIYIEGKRIRKKLTDLDQLQRDARGRKRSESQQNSLLENLFLAAEKENCEESTGAPSTAGEREGCPNWTTFSAGC